MDGHDIFPEPYEWCIIILNIIVFLIATTGMLLLRYVVGRILRSYIPDVLYDIKRILTKNMKYFDRQYNGNICHWPKQDRYHDDIYKYIFI